MATDLSPEIFTADYTGEPGARAFFIQAQAGGGSHTFELEKGQVQILAEKLHEMLVAIDPKDTIGGAKPARDPVLVADPDQPAFRVGSIGLAYDEDSDLMLVLIEEFEPETEDEPEEPAAEAVRLSLRRDQIRAFVLHALAVVEEGRPVCQLCSLPMDPEGHVCPASNGHHPDM